MEFRFSRRKMMQGAAGAALAQSVEIANAAAPPRKWPIEEGPGTPRISLSPGDGGGPLPAALQPQAPAAPGAPAAAQAGRGGGGPAVTAAFYPRKWKPRRPRPGGPGRRLRRQSGGRLPAHPPAWRDPSAGVSFGGGWTEENIRRTIQTAKDAGLVAYNAMINVPNSVIYGRDTRAKDLEPFIASIEAAGKAGLPVVEYNFYAHRIIEAITRASGEPTRATPSSITTSKCSSMMLAPWWGLCTATPKASLLPNPGRLPEREKSETPGSAAAG